MDLGRLSHVSVGPSIIKKMYHSEKDADNRKAKHMWGKGLLGKSLYFLFNFT